VASTIQGQLAENGLETGFEPATLLGVLGNWTAGDGPLYGRLASAVRAAVDRGDVVSGTRLPPERLLARSLAVSRSTVVAAYDRLRDQRVVDRRQGSGTHVLAAHRQSGQQLGERVAGLNPAPRRNTLFRRSADGPDGTIDFLGAYLLGASGVPASALSDLDEEITSLSRSPGYAPLGHPPFRAAVASHLSRTGLPTVPEQIMVTCGAQQAINVVARNYLQHGDTVLVENPTYPGALDAFSAAGARLAWVPTGRHGADIDMLGEVLSRTAARLVYLIPTFQNPVGGVMPELRRRSLVRLLEERRVPLLEDESLSGLPLDDDALPPPIAAYSSEATILTAGSLSKLFRGGLRVGWVRGPEHVIAQLGRLKAVSDLGTSVVSQVIGTRLLELFEATRRDRCTVLANRYALMSELLEQHLPSWSWERPRGGLCLWVGLPYGSAAEFAQVALRHGVSLVPGPVSSPDSSFSEFLRLPFGLEEPDLREGVRRLALAWQAYVPLVDPARQTMTVIV
jgi:DNA-binding transcriptional MocR family regulator